MENALEHPSGLKLDLDALSKQDPDQWEIAFRIIKPYVHARVRTIVNGAGCDDITQEVLLAIWRYVKGGWQPATVDDLIRRSVAIARNKSLDQVKNLWREPLLEDHRPNLEDLTEEPREHFADLVSLRVAFQECLALLAHKLRLPILLRLQDELTFRQIAEKLNHEPLDTIYSRFNLGRKKLKACLTGKGFGREFME